MFRAAYSSKYIISKGKKNTLKLVLTLLLYWGLNHLFLFLVACGSKVSLAVLKNQFSKHIAIFRVFYSILFLSKLLTLPKLVTNL